MSYLLLKNEEAQNAPKCQSDVHQCSDILSTCIEALNQPIWLINVFKLFFCYLSGKLFFIWKCILNDYDCCSVVVITERLFPD